MFLHRLALGLVTSTSLLWLGGCATEASRGLPVAQVEAAATPYRGAKVSVVVGKMDNRSSYLRGVFTEGPDRLGAQAKTVLMAHLQQSQRFGVMDRDNLAETRAEAQYQSQPVTLRGAQVVIAGDISEFGRKEVGDTQLFGLLGQGKQQIAYAKVTLNVIDSRTSEVVYSVQGAGEYSLTNREVLGFGGTASYDATLNGKVLDLALREAVNRLVAGLDAGAWGQSRP